MDNKELQTPGGHTVLIKVLSVREMLPIIKARPENPTQEQNIDSNLAMVEAAVVSIDGSSENIPEAIQGLPFTDYAFLSKELSTLTGFQETKN